MTTPIAAPSTDNASSTVTSPFVYPYQPYHQPYYVDVIDVILLGLIVLAGVLGNLLIFATILTDKRLQNQSNALVLNIAFADILIMAFVLPVVMGNVLYQSSILGPAGCVLASCVVVITAAVSIFSMAAISLNRYFFICRNHEYERYFSKRNTIILIATVWSFWSTLVGVTAIWQPHYYNPDSLICIFDHQRSLIFTSFLMIFGIGLPAVITFICYYKIYKKISHTQKVMRHHQNKMSVISNHGEGKFDRRKSMRKMRENRATAALFVAFMCFLIFWGPYGVAAIVYYFQRLPQYTIKYLSWLGMSNSCVNSFVYGALNKTYWDGYKRILTCGRSRVDPNTRTQSVTQARPNDNKETIKPNNNEPNKPDNNKQDAVCMVDV